MLLTKLGHSCVRLEKDGARLVIDPGLWSGPEVLAGASAILVTHEHNDHLDDRAVRAALAGDPDLQLWANETVAGQFADFSDRVHAVRHGDTFTVPEEPVPVLLVPVTAPWLKFSEVADYIRMVAPERGYWIHDALVNDNAAQLLTNLLTLAPARSGPASYLVPGTSVEL